jgi:hypothetical protein
MIGVSVIGRRSTWFKGSASSLVIALALVLGSESTADAAIITIDVAELSWIVTGDDTCTAASPEFCQSVFTLTYLWLDGASAGPAPAPASITADLSTDAGTDSLTALSGSIDTLAYGGVSSFASATISFNFLGLRSVGPQSLTPVSELFDGSGLPSLIGIATLYQYQYDDSTVPVAEPSTVILVALGLVAAQRRMRRG